MDATSKRTCNNGVPLPVGLYHEARRLNISLSKTLQEALNEKIGTKYNANAHSRQVMFEDEEFKF